MTIEKLKHKVSKILNTKIDNIKNLKINKKSIDAREKLGGFYVLALDIEIENEKKYLNIKNVEKVQPFSYEIPKRKFEKSPVIIGFGPAGLMSALILARSGANPIVIERGKCVEERSKDINKFWKTGTLNENSNVQFGEGGAGTFSDGKLTTGIKDFRCRVLLEEFVKASAPEEILYMAKPHIGTDKLITMVKNMREEIISLGGQVLFEHKAINLISENNCIKGVSVENLKTGEIFDIKTNHIVLAIGHSARDTFEMIKQIEHPIEKKSFAVGVRIEHSQELINNNQYGKFACYLPPADYKLAVRLPNRRGAYTFCMCPGGYVVNASSENKRLVTNGMSYYSRSGENANSALLIEVHPEDLDSDDILSGVKFQRDLEEKAFIAGGSNYYAPVQKIGDLLKEQPSTNIGNIKPTFKPGVTPCNFKDIFPEFIYQSIKLGIIEMDKKIKGFADENGLLTAVESRSSSPIRILRDENFQSVKFKGLYPCGEGCGYAGGIVSAGVDGIKCAEAILNN
ncbi:MAG: FAD-binding protein [Eubacteriales bacterium]|nr:FAD-binding protein [Eubacteriales bacterium]